MIAKLFINLVKIHSFIERKVCILLNKLKLFFKGLNTKYPQQSVYLNFDKPNYYILLIKILHLTYVGLKQVFLKFIRLPRKLLGI